MFAIDTNILVYAHFERYPQHRKARQFCQERLFGADEWCLAWQVCYEYVRIATHPAVHDEPLTFAAALADLRPYLAARTCHVLAHGPGHLQTLEALVRQLPRARGNFVHDCHYAALLRDHGVRTIYTADQDFRRFDFLEVIDPTT